MIHELHPELKELLKVPSQQKKLQIRDKRNASEILSPNQAKFIRLIILQISYIHLRDHSIIPLFVGHRYNKLFTALQSQVTLELVEVFKNACSCTIHPDSGTLPDNAIISSTPRQKVQAADYKVSDEKVTEG